MGNIGNGVLNTFVDNQIVSANGTAPAPFENALNPKMQIIQTAIDDNDTRIEILEGQLTALGTTSVQYNVKAAPFNAVGNGIADDTAAIQAAITQASTNKGVVVFPTGTYKITSRLTIAGNCIITADGAGIGVTIRQTNTSLFHEIFRITGSNVTISNLTLDSYADYSSSYGIISDATITATSPITNVFILNCSFASSTAATPNAISLRYVTGVLIKNCTFTASATGGLRTEFLGCSNMVISENTATGRSTALGAGLTDVWLWIGGRGYNDDYSAFFLSNNITVEKNTLTNSPIYLQMVGNCDVLNNNFLSTISGIGTTIFINSPAYVGYPYIYSKYVTIQGNIVDGTDVSTYNNSGISVLYANRIFIEQNSVTEVNYGVNVNNVTTVVISRNDITACRYGGIRLEANCANAVVSNNTLTDIFAPSPVAAILCQTTSTSLASVTGNTLTRGSKTATFVNSNGLSVTGSTVQVSGNYFTSASMDAYTTLPGSFMFYEDNYKQRVFFGYHVNTGTPTGGWRYGDIKLEPSPTAGGYIGQINTFIGNSPPVWKGYGAIQA